MESAFGSPNKEVLGKIESQETVTSDGKTLCQVRYTIPEEKDASIHTGLVLKTEDTEGLFLRCSMLKQGDVVHVLKTQAFIAINWRKS
ncbi:MAG: hypothetical protein ABA06_02305 [Parcubacteria bacterium C7867-001]|nr:MAG: hypothetical protein ABA06_02305 [Parcubacteria bacterium C7867-001]